VVEAKGGEGVSLLPTLLLLPLLLLLLVVQLLQPR